MKQQINRTRRSHTSHHQSSQIQLSPVSTATLRNVAFIVFLCVSSLLSSITWHIKQDGTGDFTFIQEGINASSHGDIVLVYPGYYCENINYSGKNITVASLELTTGDPQYISQTIIDGQRLSSCVAIVSGETDAVLRGLTITNGQGDIEYPFMGGGISIYSVESNTIFCNVDNCILSSNYAYQGAGIFIRNGTLSLSGTKILDNNALFVGGALCILDNSHVNFDQINLCDIYNNSAAYMTEIVIYSLYISNFSLIVDKFTVLYPDNYFIGNTSGNIINYNFEILSSYLEPVDHDLYVSPNGNDNNSGLSPDDPLRTINLAMRKIVSNRDNPKTVYLASGVYSNTMNQLQLPFGCKSFVNIIGDSYDTTIFDGENEISFFLGLNGYTNSIIKNISFINGNFRNSLFQLHYTNDIEIKEVKMRNGFISNYGAGIVSSTSGGNIILENVIIENIEAPSSFYAGTLFNGTYSFRAENCIISNNSCTGYNSLSAGLYVMSSGDITIDNCKFINNRTVSTTFQGNASAFLCTDYNDVMGNTYINNCLFTDNTNIGGRSTIYAKSLIDGMVSFTNNTVVDNEAPYGIEFKGNIDFRNNILRNSSYYEICLNILDPGVYSTLNVSYNNIDGGINAIHNSYNLNTINWLEGNIDADPLFLGSGDDPYQLTEFSPCIDVGTPDTTGLFLPPWDLLFNQRVWDGDGDGIATIDMGCYEYGSSYASGFISGFVIDTSGNLLENAEITAGNFTTFSNENGEYDLEAIVGTYDVICYLEDYEVSVMENVVVILGETTTVNFMLDPAVNTNDVLNPKDIQLTNYPNPFNPDTRIVFGLPEAGRVEVIIYNIKGQKVKTLLDCTTVPGQYNCIWDGRNAGGKRVASGEYIVKLQVNGEEKAVRKMLLLR